MMKYTTQKLKALALIALSGLSGFSYAQSTPPSAFKWSQAGPVYNAGRSRNLVVDQRDASGNTMYTGSASSGVFKTTNGGVLWSVANNTTTVLNISYMAQDASNDIWVATGEGFLRPGQKAKAQVGTGLYKLDDNGELTQNANMAVSVTGTVINRIACHPTDATKMALATNRGILVGNPQNGFILANIPTGTTTPVGMDVKFNSAGILYCTMGGEAAGSPSSKVYKSDNTLQNFTEITPLSSVLGYTTVYGRIELAIAPSNNNVVYASIANKYGLAINLAEVPISAYLKALFVSYDGGTNWALLHQGSAALDPLTNGANIATGDYAHTIGVNPGNPNQIWVAGYRFYICSISGSTSNPVGQWLPIGSDLAFGSPYYLHQNIHDIKPVGSGTSAKFYFVTDAGIYRSVDLANGSVTGFASFQAFYKGLVTGQFNSVSIEAYPAVLGEFPKNNNEKIDPLNGFIGGTGGNGFTYFSGDYAVSTPTDFATVAQETNYLSGEVYNVEYSKILPGAAFLTVGKDRNGDIYRSSNVKTSAPVSLQVNSYKGALSQIVQSPTDFLNNANTNTGSIFRLWENYGQVATSPDSIVFYNDSIRVSTSIGDVPTLISQSTFSFQVGRPNKNALIDSIAIRTGTVIYEATNPPKYVSAAFNTSDKKDIFVKLPNNYTTPTATTVPPIGSIMGPASAAKVILNATSGLDEISVTFTAPPFANKTNPSQTGVPSPAVFYRVFATIFYKYKAQDTVYITDNSISTKPMTYTVVMPGPRRWAASSNTGPKPVFPPYNQPVKVPARYSARLAVGFSGTGTDGVASAIIVSKSPLSLNDPLTYIRVSGDKALTMDANGNSTNSVISIPSKPSLIEWSKSGTELYYATEDNNLYRVSNIFTIMDYSPGNNYSGKLTTDIFKYNGAASNPFSGTTPNPMSPYRTTLIGSFNKPITSIAIRDDKYMALTFNDPSGDIVKHSDPNQDIRKCDYTNSGFATRNGSGLSNLTTYCSLIEKDDSKKMFVGTDKGVYYTNDVSVSAPIWTAINNGQLPAVQVFDIEQQTMGAGSCYNSGQIYVATYGRGVWTNKQFYTESYVSIEEQKEKPKAENNLSIFPNPTNGKVFINFNSLSGENASLQVMDMNGRLVKSEPIGKLYAGQVSYSFETSDLSAGIYIVSVNSDSNVKRVAKLVVAK